MVYRPRKAGDVSESIEARLRGRVAQLTKFIEGSFNKVFLDAFSEEIHNYEVQLLAAQLSGWVEYAGGPITQTDLERLGIPEFDDLALLNTYMRDEHLDYLGSIVGVSRDSGTRATGQIRVDTFASDTRVPDGMEVQTPDGVDIDRYVYSVDIDSSFVTPDDQGNSDYVLVDIVANDVGDEYNVGAEKITQFSSPPPGVESVTNPQAIDGGEDEESNDSLRERIANAVFQSSGGGTTDGIEGFIVNNTEANDVFVNEFLSDCPPSVNVVVDGGTDTDVTDSIETSRPAGIEHFLVRPTEYSLAVTVELRGSDIDTATVKQQIEDYIFDLDLGDDYIEDIAKQQILNAESNIDNILAYNTRITSANTDRIEYESGTDIYSLAEDDLGSITGEDHLYQSGESLYELDVFPIESGTASVTAIVNGTEQSVSDTEWDIVDDDGDGMLDSIDWSVGSITPDDQTVWSIDYDTKRSASETLTYQSGTDQYSLTYLPALNDDSSVTDNSGDTYVAGTDYEIVDTNNDGVNDSIDWSIGGSTPDDTEDFTVSYEVDVGSINNVTGGLNGTEETEFTEGVDFNEIDDDSDSYDDAIDWSVGGNTPDDGTQFTVDASVQSSVKEDYFTDKQEKLTPVVDEIDVIVYE